MSFVDLGRETAFHLRVRKGWTVRRSDDGVSFLVGSDGPIFEVADASVWLPAGPFVSEYQNAVDRLATGAPLGDLRDEVIAAGGGPARAAACLIWLQRLYRWGFIELSLVGETGEVAVVLPQWESFVPTLAPTAPAASVQLDRFACLRRVDSAWLLESPLCGARLSFADLGALEDPLVRRFLSGVGFLEAEHTLADPRREALAQWEFHDLLLHMHHQVGWHRDPIGAMFLFIGRIEPAPAVRAPWPGERIELARAPDETGAAAFASVLQRRRSERFYDEDHRISVRDLGVLLDRSARIRGFEEIDVGNILGRTSRFEITRRPYPNGGASYELEIYAVVDRCEGLESGIYHYEPDAHVLVRIGSRTPGLERLVADAKTSTAGLAHPQIVLILAARFSRVMWKYRSISYAVILRNCGALYQTLYLAATEFGLSPCGLGSVNAAEFAQSTGLDPVIEGAVGAFILGGRPRNP